jgi:hypothetical protein
MEIVLGRIGHYFTPTDGQGNGSCQTATIANVEASEPVEAGLITVNLGVLEHSGESFARQDVVVGNPSAGLSSFHLTRDCPWSR